MLNTKQDCIGVIESMFPADDPDNPGIAVIGMALLAQAKEQVQPRNWRDESMEVLRVYASLCIERDNNPQPRR